MLDRLRKRGWSEEELADLDKRYTPRREGVFLMVVFLSLLLFAVTGVPYAYAVIGHLLVDQVFYLLLVVVGTPLGAVFGILLVDMYRFSRNHHLALLLFTPLLCVGATYVSIAYAAANAPVGAFTHNALIGALVYAVSFIAPYAFLVMQEWNSKIVFGN